LQNSGQIGISPVRRQVLGYHSLFFPLLLFSEGMKMRSTKQEPNGIVKANKAVSISSLPERV